MKRAGKSLGDARQPVAVVATSERADPRWRKRKAGVGVGLSMRHELLRQFVPQYHKGSFTQKQAVLADFVRLTGYHRKYAILYEVLTSSVGQSPHIVSLKGGRLIETMRISNCFKERTTMTTSYYADRINLFQLKQHHPNWTQQQLATAVERSKSWVQKWQKRFADVPLGDPSALHRVALGLSQARKTPPERIHEHIEALILELRDHPPEGLRRTPGPKTILYYLPRHVSSWDSGRRLPTSTRTIYRILKRNQRIASRVKPPPQEELPRQAPMQCWQIDFKDISSVVDDPLSPTGKKQHIAEAFNIVDEGTSILLYSEVRSDFTAETLLLTLGQAIKQLGLPQRITLDRDPRSVGAPSGSDFPSALLRFGRTLGIEMHVCAPRHPQENGFVERYHRSYQQECVAVARPHTLEQARMTTTSWVEHYNQERPNQALSCGNLPPRTAFAQLPQLSPVPAHIEADGWLKGMDGFHVERKVSARGMVHLDLHSYYVDVHRKGQRVTLQLQAESREVSIWHEATFLKSVPLRGQISGRFSFEQFVEQMAHQARAFHRLRSLQERRKRRE